MGLGVDPDGTITIPWWVNFAIKFIPAPWGQVVALIVKIIDNLPAPKKAELARAYAEAKITGDDSKLTQVLHEVVVEKRDTTDHIK